VHGSYPQTHTSISTSSTTFPLTDPDSEATKPLTLVDLPGHPRLKDEMKKYIKTADAVIFVVDIVGLVRNAGVIAE
jgi:signal recognition particle receptor subunit beta